MPTKKMPKFTEDEDDAAPEAPAPVKAAEPAVDVEALPFAGVDEQVKRVPSSVIRTPMTAD